MFFRLFLFFCFLLIPASLKVFASCSPLVGAASINELYKEGGNNSDVFIEFKLIDTSILAVTYNQWKLRICHDAGQGNNKTLKCEDIPVAQMNDGTQWIWIEQPIVDRDFIDFKDGFDLSLLDENDDFIDYIQIAGYSGQNFTSSCSYNDLAYVYPIPHTITNGTKELLRKPDGTGQWFESKNLNQYPPSPGSNNDLNGGDDALVNYRFDECSYTGADFEVVDQTGAYSATSYGGVNTYSAGKVERGAEITDEHHHFKTNIPLPSEFTVSTWFKKPTSTSDSPYFVLGAMQAGGDLLYIDRGNRWRWGVYNASLGSVNGSYSFSSLDNNWHHMTLVYSGGQTQLYIDGSLKDTVNTVPSGTLQYIGTSFDDVSSNNPQGFRAPLDEFIIFKGALSAAKIIDVYTNQNAANNFDGSIRSQVQCATVLANYRFDECTYTGVGFEVIDQTSNYPATSHGDVNTFENGKIERGVNLFESEHHFETSIVLPNEFSVSTWFKKPTSTSDNPYFVLGAMQAGGDLLYIDRSNNWRWGVYNATSGSVNGSYSFSSLDNNWHHMVLVYSGGQTRLYIDGTLKDTVNKAPSGTLKYIGTSFDGVSSSAPQGFRAPLDEFIFFDNTLTTSEVVDIYSNQNTENNYDGSRRDAVTCQTLIAEYQFDEISWSGALSEVIDETGNFNGQAKGGVSTANSTPARIGNPGTCRYGSFDGIDDYVEVADAPELDLLTELSVATWIKPESIPSSGLKTILSKDENYEFHLNSSGEIYWWWGTNSFTTSGAGITVGNWYHVAITYKSGKQSIYVNGVEKGSRAFTGNLPLNNDPLQIGQDQHFSGRYFHGFIDEVSIYSNALSATDVNDIYLKTHPCTSYIDHFEITHDGQGLTCEEENITVKACEDAACSNLNNDTMIVQLSINGTPDKFVTVAGGTTDTSFAYTNVGTAALSLDQAYTCKNGVSTSCDVVFANAGFRFLYGATESTTIGNQTSGNVFNEVLQLQAVEDENGVCTGLFTGNVEVELSQQNVNPASATGRSFNINGITGTAINKHPLYTPNITLNFGAKSIAVIPAPVYLDAGQIRLHAKYDDSIVSLVGNSNDFWVSPAKLVASAQSGGTDIDGSSNTSTTTHKAGQAFDFTVTAVNAQGDTTLNYSANDIQLLLTRTGPTGGVDGSFNYGNGNGTMASSLAPTYQSVSLSTFNSGVSFSNTASYSEVGLLKLELQDVDYGFSGNTIVGDAINIGRFIPDYFEQSVVEPGSLDAVCNQNTPFVYTGQTLVGNNSKGAISYLVNPVVELTAKNAQGATTENYTQSGFMKLVAAANFIVKPITDSLITGNDSNLLPLTANMHVGTVSQNGLVNGIPSYGLPLDPGVLHYELSSEDDFLYPRNANSEIIAQNNDIDFLIDQANFIDSDGVGITTPVNITGTAPINLRFGRAYLENSFGPETADLPQPFSVQYLNTSGSYVTNTQDDCTNFDTAKITLTSGTLNKTLTSVNPISGKLDDGKTRDMLLTAPGAGNQGSIGVEYDIDAWLKYDWSWDGVSTKAFTDNPAATATFGLFRGNDRIIYQREVNN